MWKTLHTPDERKGAVKIGRIERNSKASVCVTEQVNLWEVTLRKAMRKTLWELWLQARGTEKAGDSSNERNAIIMQ